jgi:hypothetical protein
MFVRGLGIIEEMDGDGGVELILCACRKEGIDRDVTNNRFKYKLQLHILCRLAPSHRVLRHYVNKIPKIGDINKSV